MGLVKHDPVDRAELAEMYSGLSGVAATTSTLGMVKKTPTVASLSVSSITDAPAGGTGAAAGGWDTANNRDAAIAAINACIDSIGLLEAKVNDLLAKLRTAGIVTT